MYQGWISLHRQLLEWEWYSDINTSRLFIHCMLKANHQPAKWRGIAIDRGQFITSLDKLSAETSLTKSQIRTALKKLISTHEIAQESGTQHTVITIVNYDLYQPDSTRGDTPVTRESHTDDTQIAPNNNNNNKKTDNNGNKKQRVSTVDYSILNATPEDINEITRIRKKNKGGAITQRVANALAKEFQLAINMGYSFDELLTEWEVRGWKSFKAEWIKPKQINGVSKQTSATINNLQDGF